MPDGWRQHLSRTPVDSSQPLDRNSEGTPCPNCRVWGPPTGTSSLPRVCHHHREFAPNANRFSILAHLDEQPNQTKWAFDFVHQSRTTSARRRGKRGGKANKPKGTEGKSEALHDVYREAPQLEAGEYSSPDDQSSFRDFRLDESTQGTPRVDKEPEHSRWFIDGKGDTHAITVNLPQSPERCFPLDTRSRKSGAQYTASDFKRRESRFFPLSAFLTASEMAKSSKLSPNPDSPKSTMVSKSTVNADEGPAFSLQAQKAATTGARQSVDKQTVSPLLNIATTSASSNPLPTPSPLAITPSMTLSPMLSIPSAISPSSYGMLTPNSPSPGSLTRLLEPSPAPNPTSRPTPVPRNFLTSYWSPTPWQSNDSSPLLPKSLPISFQSDAAAADSEVDLKRSSTQNPHLDTEQVSTKFGNANDMSVIDFLKLGHANPCWCRDHTDLPSPDGFASVPIVVSASTEIHDPAEAFERIEIEHCDDEGWTVLLPDVQTEGNACSLKSQRQTPEPAREDSSTEKLTNAWESDAQQRLFQQESLDLFILETAKKGDTKEEPFCEMCRENEVCSCACEWPSLQEAAEMLHKTGAGTAGGQQNSKAKLA